MMIRTIKYQAKSRWGTSERKTETGDQQITQKDEWCASLENGVNSRWSSSGSPEVDSPFLLYLPLLDHDFISEFNSLQRQQSKLLQLEHPTNCSVHQEIIRMFYFWIPFQPLNFWLTSWTWYKAFWNFPTKGGGGYTIFETHFWGVNHYSSGKLNLDRND